MEKRDEDLILEYQHGDNQALEELFARYKKPIFNFALRILSNRADAEDITGEVMLILFTKAHTYDPRPDAKFSTWLFTIARNKSINASRKKRPRSMSEPPEGTCVHNPGGELGKKEFFVRLDGALQTLPAAQRRAFVLAEFEKLPYAEIALIERTRIGTIKSRINRAKRKLRLVLDDLAGGVE